MPSKEKDIDFDEDGFPKETETKDRHPDLPNPKGEKEYVTEYVKHIFTPEERNELLIEMAENLAAAQEAEEERKAIRKITNGYEMRHVKCEVVYDFKNSLVYHVRTDNGDIVKTRKMTDDDRQTDILTFTGEKERGMYTLSFLFNFYFSFFQARQGDIFVKSSLVNDTENITSNKRVVLGHGEATGHLHQIKNDACFFIHPDEDVEQFALTGASNHPIFIDVVKQADLIHQEHNTINIPATDHPDVYHEIIRQREYTPERIKYVQD